MTIPSHRYHSFQLDRSGSLPEGSLREAELVELFRPLLHADLTLVETYIPTDGGALPCPVTVFSQFQLSELITGSNNEHCRKSRANPPSSHLLATRDLVHLVALSLPARTGEPEVDLGAALKAIKEQLRGIPQEGIGYGLLTRGWGEALPQGELLFNYLGQFDQSIEGSLLAFADEPTGCDVGEHGPREHLIDINGAIRQGQLRLTFSYSGECSETIEGVADNYRQHLLLLIEHCQHLASQQPKLDTLLPLQTKGELPPLFCMPGLGSKVGYFHSLAT